MMRKILYGLACLLSSLLLLSSCSSKKDLDIPLDAALVLHIDGKNINEKLPWPAVYQSKWFQVAQSESGFDSFANKLLKDPTETGLDIAGDGWLFVVNKGKGAYQAMVWDLSDAAKLESLMKKSSKKFTINKKGSNSYIIDGNSLLIWDEKKIMLLNDASELTREINSSTNPLDGGMEEVPEEEFAFTANDLLVIAQEIKDLKASQKLSEDDKFDELMDTKGDVHFWFNLGKMYGNSLNSSLLSLSKVNALIDGNISTATVQFNDGSIDVSTKGYASQQLEDLYEKYKMTPFDETSLQNIPAGEVNLALAINYPPAGVKALLTLLGFDGLANMFLQNAGFSLDDFIKGNGGNLFLTLSDFNVKKVYQTAKRSGKEVITDSTTEMDGKLLFGAEVKERKSFDKMIDLFKTMLPSLIGGETDKSLKIPYQIRDKWFLAGNDSTQVNKYAAAKTNHAFIDRIKGHPIGLYVNLSSLFKGGQAVAEEDPLGKQAMELSQTFWKELTLTGGTFSKGASTNQIKITLGESNKNSLQSLNQYLGKIVTLIQENEQRETIPEPVPVPAPKRK
ncbi:MAG: DUF4836 family protein [Bacteroidetes bacterium]|nr:DUF4836 family protein [Bacteroidota bacterium]